MGDLEVQSHVFLAPVLAGGEWSVSCSGERSLGIQWIRGWVGPITHLDGAEGRKILSLPVLDFGLQPVASRYKNNELRGF
jgi:hypothetical protein